MENAIEPTQKKKFKVLLRNFKHIDIDFTRQHQQQKENKKMKMKLCKTKTTTKKWMKTFSISITFRLDSIMKQKRQKKVFRWDTRIQFNCSDECDSSNRRDSIWFSFFSVVFDGEMESFRKMAQKSKLFRHRNSNGRDLERWDVWSYCATDFSVRKRYPDATGRMKIYRASPGGIAFYWCLFL